MTRLVRLIFIAILLLSCKESKQNRIARLVNEWNGKIIQFPDSMCLTSYRNDTAIVKYIREQTPYTILNYVDTIGCVSCRLQLPRWKTMMEELDSLYPNKVTCLMVFNPQGKRKLIKHLRNNQFNYFVYIDEMDILNRMNKFLNEEDFGTFLLDKNDKIVAIGNPVLKPRVRDLYFHIISGKMVVSSVDKEALTVVSLLKDKVDLGDFSWNKEREAEFVISNVGKLPLVINDVITSCGCTKVDYTKKPILSGENIILKIKYKAEQPEHFNKTITVYCNAEGSPFHLKISGNAK
ncbi:DUF1573 domain-containing protein [Bacteroides xylanisolvens]|jgi:hypothetical protein|uniref:DUF1573 domain-containing protein n=1 Tax=Bacteroides xylanisolvens TaxID=371601 RepID=A0A415KV83_9BACE|nr:DUF1573 domain-containing protein [Bacteroides xylanisolvens]RHF36633.1 DUF1573 domain-containing protein [Bacteroides xylanisolvens]RHL40056.1 DUF1573 domain-containing protein [Bacteroides xylanisolvens]